MKIPVEARFSEQKVQLRAYPGIRYQEDVNLESGANLYCCMDDGKMPVLH